MIGKRVRLLITLSRREWRELLLACAWQLRVRIVLLRQGGVVTRLATIAGRQRRIVREPLPNVDVARLARWSGVICRGSCLSDAFVHQILAARHGLTRRVTIGVARDGDALRAHAWTGDDEGDGRFAAVWSNPRSTQE